MLYLKSSPNKGINIKGIINDTNFKTWLEETDQLGGISHISTYDLDMTINDGHVEVAVAQEHPQFSPEFAIVWYRAPFYNVDEADEDYEYIGREVELRDTFSRMDFASYRAVSQGMITNLRNQMVFAQSVHEINEGAGHTYLSTHATLSLPGGLPIASKLDRFLNPSNWSENAIATRLMPDLEHDAVAQLDTLEQYRMYMTLNAIDQIITKGDSRYDVPLESSTIVSDAASFINNGCLYGYFDDDVILVAPTGSILENTFSKPCIISKTIFTQLVTLIGLHNPMVYQMYKL